VGAWAEGAFDNDDAADWVLQFDGADQASGLRLIEDALKQAAETGADRYLEIDAGARAVAAAELVTHIAGQPVRQTPCNEDVLRWAAQVSPDALPSLADLARRGVARVAGPGSELAELWDEAGPSWRTSMAELASKLQAADLADGGR
jgi:hypothetical protein